MQQHPVPQNIASFKFKLFGSLTARQFFTLIIPLSFAAVIFFSGVPSVIRIPLSLTIGGFAFFIALVPIGGRPFDKWAVAFIKAVMSPTQRVWIKEKKIPEFLTMIITPPASDQQIPEEFTSKKKERLMAYLKTLPKNNASPLDVKEEIALSDIDFAAGPSLSLAGASGSDNFPPPIIWPSSPYLGGQKPLSTQPVIASGNADNQKAQITSNINMAPKIGSSDLKPQYPSAASLKTKVGSSRFEQSNIAMPQAPISAGKSDLPPVPVAPIKEVPLPEPPNMAPAQAPKISLHARPYILKGIEKRIAAPKPPEPEYVELVSEPTVNLASDTNYSFDNVISVRTPDNKIRLVHGIGTTRARKLHFAPPVNFDISKLPIRGEKRFEISDELKKRYRFEDTSPPVVLPTERKPGIIPQVARPHIQSSIQNIPQKPSAAPGPTGQQIQSQQTAQKNDDTYNKFSVTDLKKQQLQQKQLSNAEIIPLTRTPNVISGQVIDGAGGPIAGAVLVIRDVHGIPVRALKTNKLGQFLSATPLTSGTYNIETESELAKFEPFSINLKNQIVPPIAIYAQGAQNG